MIKCPTEGRLGHLCGQVLQEHNVVAVQFVPLLTLRVYHNILVTVCSLTNPMGLPQPFSYGLVEI